MKKLLTLSTLALLAACGNATNEAEAASAAASQNERTGPSTQIGDAPNAPVTYTTEVIADGLQTAYGMAFLPSGDMLVTEKSGSLRVIRDDRLLPAGVEGLPEIYYRSQAGLFDVVLHPDFAENSVIYLTYAHGDRNDNATRLARARYVPTEESARLEDFEVLFTAAPARAGGHHYGGKLVFLADGTMLLGTGDGGRLRDQAPKRDNHLGKTIRLNDDGSVPADNPFVGEAGAMPEIWSYGHRNIQGLIFDATSGIVYSHEHGPRGGDEVNIIEKGKNYGWPIITYGIEYSGGVISPFTERDGLEQPVVYYTPSIAPSGLVLYRGDKFPEWEGDLFIGALAHKHVRRIDLDENGNFGAQEKLFTELDARIRDIRVGPEGYFYVLTDGDGAQVLRVRPQ